MSYHIKGAKNRAAELLKRTGIKLTAEEKKNIRVEKIVSADGATCEERVSRITTPDGIMTIFETTELA